MVSRKAGAVKEIPLKQWFAEEAQILGIGAQAVAARMYSLGKYPDIPKRYVNRRVVYVPADYHPTPPEHPRRGEIRLKMFCAQEMERLNLPTPKAAYTRFSRGWYTNRLEIRRVNRSTVYVKWICQP